MKLQLLLIIAALFFSITGKAQNAKIDSLQKVLLTQKEDTAKVNTLNALAYEFRNNKPDTAIYFANEANLLATKLQYKTGIADAYLYIGIATKSKGQYKEAISNSNDAIRLYDELLASEKSKGNAKILKQKAAAYNNIGIVYQEQGNYAEALNNHRTALKIREEIADKKGIAGSYNNLGLVYWNQGIYPEALNYYFAALKINEETGNKSLEANNRNNIGVVYFEQGNYPEALKNYFASLKIAEELKDKRGIADTYLNIGRIYSKQNNYSEALKNYSEALKICEERGDAPGIAFAYFSLGLIYYSQNNYPEALNNYFDAMKIGEKIGDKHLIIMSYAATGIIYTNQKKIREASEYLNKSLVLAKETGNLFSIYSGYSNLAVLDSMQGNFTQAFEHYKMYITYRDSLFNEENTKKIVQTQMQYDFDKKEDSTRAEQEKKDVLAKAALEVLNRENEIQKLKVKDQQSQLMQSSLLATKKENEIQILNQTREIQLLDLNKQKGELKEQALITESKDKEVQLLNKDNELNQKEISKQKLIRNATFSGIGIAAIFSFFLVLSYNRRRKTVFEKQVSQVEMTALRSQMNPHFIFNSLHSINNYVLNNDKKNASDYLGKFSKLMRLILENSREQEVPLEKDLLTLELYMELEAMRFENKFSYKIEVADDLDPENTLVPPMILQPFVENSILHGLQHKESEGKIIISVQKENNMIVCTVEDNGVGREKAMGMKEKTSTHKGESLGMKITNARIDIINKIKKAKASVNLTDLSEGMRVEVKLPFELAF